MTDALSRQPGRERRTARPARARKAATDPAAAARARILAAASQVRVFDSHLARNVVRSRQERGHDKYDEVWEGVYVVPPLANNPHQLMVSDLVGILREVVRLTGKGLVLPGANVSDRRSGWDHNFRAPDVVVVLNDGRAIDCGTHWFGGPDFLIEIQSPRDDTDEKIPFYGRIQVRELLIVHRDTRELRLYRHDGRELVPVEPADFQGKKWLVSAVVPLAFRRTKLRGGSHTAIRRTDGQPGDWVV